MTIPNRSLKAARWIAARAEKAVLDVRGKSFFLTERVSLLYEAQFSNLFNILNKAIPNMNFASSSFGQITQAQDVQQAGPRSIQMQLRLRF